MDVLWGRWNGITAWPLLVLHAFGAPFLRMLGRRTANDRRSRCGFAVM